MQNVLKKSNQVQSMALTEYNLIKRNDTRECDHSEIFSYREFRPPDNSAYWKTIYFISHPKHMLWVLKRTVSKKRFF